MKLSGELDYRIRYDVEHDLFHAQNVFNDEYIPPTFIEYVQKLEKENTELKSLKDVADLIRLNNSHIVAMAQLNNNNVALRKENAELKETVIKMNNVITETFSNLTKAKEIIKKFLLWENDWHDKTESKYDLLKQAEQFLKE